jgi:subtilisin family serine protease
MRKSFRLTALILAFTFLFANCAYSAPSFNLPWQEKNITRLTADFTPDYEPDQIIVKFKENCNKQKKEAKIKDLGLSTLEIIGDGDAELLNTGKGKTDQALEQLRSSNDVEYAVPNYRFRPACNVKASNTHHSKQFVKKRTSDTLYSMQWALQNSGQKIADPYTASLVPGKAGVDINPPRSRISSGYSSAVLVGVLDTGVDISHPDLQDQIWVNPGEIPGDSLDNDGNGYVDDINGWNFAEDSNVVFDSGNPFADGHGTAIAGVIAASANNGFGVSGVAPHAEIVCLKFINAEGIGLLSDALKALEYAKQQGIQVINASWGDYFPTRVNDPEFYQAELKPLAKAIQQSGALFVAAAGNEGQNLDTLPETTGYQYFPAAFECPNVLSVAAVDNKGALCTVERNGWASNTGAKTVDIAAPGSNVISTISLGDLFGAAIESRRNNSRTATWGFGLQDITGQEQRTSLVSRELNFLWPQWNPARGKNAPRILLVDDDNSNSSSSDCGNYWRTTFKKLGVRYQEYVVPSQKNAGDGPSLKNMKNYDLVVWQTGRSKEIPALTANDVANLTSYIEQGGNILLSGENAVAGNEGWAAQILQAQLVMEGLPCYDLTGLPSTNYAGFQCILDGSEMGTPPVSHDLYCPANPETSWSGLTFKFASISGTSIAAPHVTGTAALLYGKKMQKSPAAIRQLIMKSAKPLPGLRGKVLSGGMVNAQAALKR